MSFPAPAPPWSKATTWVIGATLFLNLLTLTLIQPILGKSILPQAGGTAGVWNFILASFGMATVLGFLSAWGLSWTPYALQVKLGGACWFVAAVLLGVANYPFVALADQPDSWLSFALKLGPFCAAIWLLSTWQFLLPWWVASRSQSGLRSAYFLLGFCHLGSLVGILGYPLLIEYYFSLATQLLSLKILFSGLGAMVLGCAFLSLTIAPRYSIEEAIRINVNRPTWLHYCRWVVLAAVAAALVLGVTTYITAEIAAIPLFWMLPLGLYETSLVVAFARLTPPRPGVLGWVVQCLAILVSAILMITVVQIFIGTGESNMVDRLLGGLFLGSLLVLMLIPHRWTLPVQIVIVGLGLAWFGLEQCHFPKPNLPFWGQIWLWLEACAVTWWGCHGDLVQTRPDDQYLFRFLACVILGVTLGNLFMQALAPVLWDDLIEFHLVLGLAVLVRLGTALANRWPLN